MSPGPYEVEESQARRGSRSSSAESETSDATEVYYSTDNSLLEPFQNLRLDGAGAVADSSRPAHHSPAGVGQEAPVPSDAGAPIQPSGPFSMGDQPMAAAVMPPAGPPMRPRKPIKSDKAKKSRSSFGPPKVSSTPESSDHGDSSSDHGDSDADADLLAADMRVKYDSLRRQLKRARASMATSIKQT